MKMFAIKTKKGTNFYKTFYVLLDSMCSLLTRNREVTRTIQKIVLESYKNV